MLRVLENHDQSQQWLGVASIMRAEAQGEADEELGKYAARAKAIAGINAEPVIREGDKAEEILKVIDEDEDIFILVLAAGIGSEGPGPWSRRLAGPRAIFPFRWRLCPAISPTKRSTHYRERHPGRAQRVRPEVAGPMTSSGARPESIAPNSKGQSRR